MKAVIVNDCSNTHHFGCLMVMESYRQELDRVGIELLGTVRNGQLKPDHYHYGTHMDLIERADIVLVNGEGSTHHDQHPEYFALAKSFPCILMNCVFQDNTEVDGLEDFLAVFTRESYSAFDLDFHGIAAQVMPDIILVNHRLSRFSGPVTQPLEYLITDSAAKRNTGKLPTALHPDLYLACLRAHSFVVCGRFHAVLACAAMGVPFCAYPSNTHKINGLMVDMGVPELMGSDVDNAMRQLLVYGASLARPKVYIERGKEQINNFFNQLADGGFNGS